MSSPEHETSQLLENAAGSSQLPTQTCENALNADASSANSDEVLLVPPELTHHDRYEVVRVLSTGGMGTVYLARHKIMKRMVASKTIHQRFTADAATVERFRREVQVCAKIQHPNISLAYDAEKIGSSYYLVMEYIEGETISRRLAREGRFSVAQVCSVGIAVLSALQHAHELGLVHRDVKPSNLMRTANGQIKLLDFGLARLTTDYKPENDEITGVGVTMGTADYIAPEQARDARAADIRSDIYSLGCTL
ncbi:MAG: serine/threonine-protein kinase [Gemmataceae bacterium]|nr:serine/threonine-protein kinase [Gemmatales bacterium]MDW8267224.1 serine/threonine-protein kinase [Gemmataceae bacterium]